MLATGGTFKIRRTQEFTTVTLPFKVIQINSSSTCIYHKWIIILFQDKRKSLVLVLPKGELHDAIPYLDSALDSKKLDGFIETKPLIIQIPALNFTISNEYFSQIFYVSEEQ